ncbi:hypothetical protein FDP41_010096 [Naegleria fowleri]|uniref:Uncharacterized protein n=1 Tax=Naegleria fowleri TaxID=5763 RepID=A0A6A5AUC3_NAEFO|nr:uncharacterized protein FDP41_010096 [Naegleria fowleri]KAF0971873.1 hypothetical protein FDP41_010096 [Naegleria fowleri]CAG4712388.1 unnamed protein product [Naegleria fowleri]
MWPFKTTQVKQPEGIYIAQSLPTPYSLGANREVHLFSDPSTPTQYLKIEIFSISDQDSIRSLATKGMYVTASANVYSSTNQEESIESLKSDHLLYQYCHSYGPCSNKSIYYKKLAFDNSEQTLQGRFGKVFFEAIKYDLGLQ